MSEINPSNKAVSVDDISSQEKIGIFEWARIRNNFYYRHYRLLIKLVLLLLTLLLASLITIYYLISHRPEAQYFATNINGEVIPIIPLNQAALTNEELIAWSARAVEKLLSFDYVNYLDQLTAAIDTYFTEKGGNDYKKALVASLNLKNVTANHLIQVAKPIGNAKIITQAIGQTPAYRNRYAWIVDVPVEILFYTGRQINAKIKQKVRLIITRSSPLVDRQIGLLDAARGIGINQLIIEPLT